MPPPVPPNDPCRAEPDTVRIKRLHPGTPDIPAYATAEAAGLDLRADLSDRPSGCWIIPPGTHDLIPTGLIFELPKGYEGQIRPRSGLAAKYGVTVLNSPGTIDSDFRGEVRVILANFGHLEFKVYHGDRIAQLVIAPIARLPIKEVNEVSSTSRGAGGFGHTGVK